MIKRIVFSYPEDYERFYGKIDYKDKVVLDIGADYGSTADFFFCKGASKVIGVEGNKSIFDQLKKNAEYIPELFPIFLYVDNSKQISDLLEEYRPDIVKIDCEGCEIVFLDLSNEIFSIPESYVVETHTRKIENDFKNKLLENNYKIIYYDNWTGDVSVIIATHL